MRLKFSKWQGTGNDFIIIDEWAGELVPEKEKKPLAVRLCDRHFGVGADGILFVSKSTKASARMRIINNDGSEAEMCGNGIRCVALFLKQKRYVKKSKFTIETLAGIMEPEIKNGLVRVRMATPRVEGLDEMLFIEDQIIRYAAVNMGNPHAVVFVEDVSNAPLLALGPKIESHPRFPNQTNVHFVQVLSRTQVKAVHWERGAGATLACGTGACAVATAAHLKGKTDSAVEVLVPGGSLHVELEMKNGKPTACFLTGPAQNVFEGKAEI
ncbi:MAG: diaminopimelate epimerase [Candidatus Micrarchaeia archaeon]